MGQRSGYSPGTFCWAELTTTDPSAAKGFYGELLGWEAEDRPMGEGSIYSMMRVGGRYVAAIAAQPAQQRDAGVPPMWNSYVSVASADESAERARELGADVHVPPFDVSEAGRMAIVRDPQGAFFELWQPNEHVGAGLVNAPGALVWNELASPDPAASASFYGGLFGWTTEPFEGMGETYLSIKNGEASAGGIRSLTPPGAPPNWLVYFATDDIDEALRLVERLGGVSLAGPTRIPVGTVALVTDAQGAVFALYEGELDE